MHPGKSLHSLGLGSQSGRLHQRGRFGGFYRLVLEEEGDMKVKRCSEMKECKCIPVK